ncbi:MAG: amino acid ABC transporter permease [Desulfosarcinaceae bacterium]|nr:amino acid ABC transporter permease [Desulfosarcinaceae bacterium]
MSAQSNASHRFAWLKLLMLVLLTLGLLWRGSQSLGYHWQWYRIPQYIVQATEGRLLPGVLLDGLYVTLQITAVSLVLAMLIGLVTALLRLSPSLLGRTVARIYLEAIRNTPLLVQLFFVYFVLAPVLGIERFAAAVIALSFFEGAYASEIFRAGILTIPEGQWEAARSIGLSTAQAYRHVVLPQAIRNVLPPLTGQSVSLIKDSALVSTVAVYDLTMQAQAIIADTYLVFEVWFTVAFIYLMITGALSLGVSVMEKRMQRMST